MITKITYNHSFNKSFTENATDHLTFKTLRALLNAEANYMTQLDRLINVITSVPDSNINDAIKLFTDLTPTITQYNKKKRSYSIDFITIWEEDK